MNYIILLLLPEFLIILVYTLYLINIEYVCPTDIQTLLIISCGNIVSHVMSVVVIILTYFSYSVCKFIMLFICLITIIFPTYWNIVEYQLPLYELCFNLNHRNMDVLYQLIVITFTNAIIIIAYIIIHLLKRT